MKNTTNTTEIKNNKEAKAMRKERFIDAVNTMYDDCYSLIWDLKWDNSFEGQRRLGWLKTLTGGSESSEDPRDEVAVKIHKALIAMYEEWPERDFPDLGIPYDADELLETVSYDVENVLDMED